METLEIEKMTQAEKLRVMETLWDSLTHAESEPESPDWHGELLASRKSKMDDGRAGFVSLDELKQSSAE